MLPQAIFFVEKIACRKDYMLQSVLFESFINTAIQRTVAYRDKYKIVQMEREKTLLQTHHYA